MLNYIHQVSKSFVVLKQAWGEYEWDSCEIGEEEACAAAHSATLIQTCGNKDQAKRMAAKMNGWD